jgi:hypothetical protein
VLDGNQTICFKFVFRPNERLCAVFYTCPLCTAAAGITRVTFLPLCGASVWMLGPLGTAVGFQAENMTSAYGAVKLIV